MSEQKKLYVLDCVDGCKYVGLTRDLDGRWAAHVSGRGAEWTRVHPPICISSERPVPDETAPWDEQRLTAELMLQHGVNKVRGANLTSRYPYGDADKPVITGTVRMALGLDYEEAGQLVDDMFRNEHEDSARQHLPMECGPIADVDALADIAGKMTIGEAEYRDSEGPYREEEIYADGDGDSDGARTQDGECGEPDFLHDDRFSTDGGSPRPDNMSEDALYSSDDAKVPKNQRVVYLDDDGFPQEEGSTSGDSFPEGSAENEGALDAHVPADSVFPEGGDSPDDDGFPVDAAGSDGSASSDQDGDDVRSADVVPKYNKMTEHHEYEVHEEKHMHVEYREKHDDNAGDRDPLRQSGFVDEDAHIDGGGERDMRGDLGDSFNSRSDSNSGREAPVSEDEGYSSDTSSGGDDDADDDDQFLDPDVFSEDVTYSDEGY